MFDSFVCHNMNIHIDISAVLRDFRYKINPINITFIILFMQKCRILPNSDHRFSKKQIRCSSLCYVDVFAKLGHLAVERCVV